MHQHVASNIILVGRLNCPRKRCVDVGHDGCFEEILEEGVLTESKGSDGSVVDIPLRRAKRLFGKVAHMYIIRLIDHLNHAVTADAQGGTRLGKHSGPTSIKVVSIFSSEIPAEVGEALLTSTLKFGIVTLFTENW
jgi:hypothetical protein